MEKVASGTKPCRLIVPWLALVIGVVSTAPAQKRSKPSTPAHLTIETIMRDPKWIGTSPHNIYWSDDGVQIYFRWNPEQAESDSLYVVSREGGIPRKVSLAERKTLPAPTGTYNRDKTRKVYENHGDIFLLDIASGRIRQITDTVAQESTPRFTHDETKVTFTRNNNVYLWRIDHGETIQLTDFRPGKKKPEAEESKTKQRTWLKNHELQVIQVLKERQEKEERAKQQR
jgi:hypothetical protein